jgi:hypothetical protein
MSFHTKTLLPEFESLKMLTRYDYFRLSRVLPSAMGYRIGIALDRLLVIARGMVARHGSGAHGGHGYSPKVQATAPGERRARTLLSSRPEERAE